MAGIYIHIPFCRKACHYCNFHFSTQLKHIPELADAIIREIHLQKDFIDVSQPIDTVYLGGGTPSLLSPPLLLQILEAVYAKFQVSKQAELTIETNPDDISEDNLIAWREAGFNRLSVGMQSFNEAELRWMNRSHTAAQSVRCLELIQQSDFVNYTVDLISGSPFCTDTDLIKSMDLLIAHRVPHISCYALTVEPGTALHHFVDQKKSPEVNQEHQARQLLLTSDYLTQHGYEHYEISNFALPGYRSRHNSSYWNGIPYWGFGPSAHSYDGKKVRRWNVSNNALYINSIAKQEFPYEEEELTAVQQYNEMLMIRLRTREGISLETIQKVFGEKWLQSLIVKTKPFLASGDLESVHEDMIRLTPKGKLLADGIAAALFEEE